MSSNNNNVINDEPPAKRSKGGLSWSKSPNDPPKYSDYTIKVTVDSNVHSTYYVHKNVMGSNSDYFDTLFSSEEELAESSISFSESSQTWISFNLPKQAADNFGQFLDCCYHGSGTIHAQSLVAVVHLADYFRSDRIQSEALDMLTKDLLETPIFDDLVYGTKTGTRQIASHFQRIRDLNNPLCLPAMAEFFRQNSGFVWYPSHIYFSEFVDLELWRLIASEPPADKSSEKLSESFAVFCHGNTVDSESFKLITGPSAMPRISECFTVGIALMNLEQKHNPNASLSATGSNGVKLTNLQERCVKAIKRGGIPVSEYTIGMESLPTAVRDELMRHKYKYSGPTLTYSSSVDQY